jgi:predicted anti-sigma-YlaC factor YlaD
MKTCEEFCQHLCDYLDGEVGPNECRLIEEHLDMCPPCAMVFESLKTTLDICNKGVSDQVPEEVQRRLKCFLREHCAKWQSQP